MLLSGLPETFAGLSDIVGQRLTAYSCGGSSGFGLRRTGFPLSSGKTFPENHDGFTYRQRGARVNSTALGRLDAINGTPGFAALHPDDGRVTNFSWYGHNGPLTPRRE